MAGLARHTSSKSDPARLRETLVDIIAAKLIAIPNHPSLHGVVVRLSPSKEVSSGLHMNLRKLRQLKSL